ncbi:MAG: dynamin family protein [Muribaculaceae bacterium]|nr:dynamin family protein [Muribaculaceae bacterium]
MDIERLIAISEDLGLLNEVAQLRLIKERSATNDCELILPLVGEFSAGKTTLINALLDSNKKLETATNPTTATLFEIHFGAERNYAQVIAQNGDVHEVEDFSSIKNEEIKDSLVVNVFDTSKKIPSSIILVDTPGLSSPVAQHRQVLVDFLPNADAILLVVDINAQMTRSLTDFISTMQLAKRPVFLVITKCDTKSEQEVLNTVNYLAQESKLPLKQVVCVSSQKGDMQQLYDLLASIQQEKGKILSQVNNQRIKNITNAMIGHIDEMLKASISDKELKQAIQEKELELRRINNKIDNMVNHSQVEIDDEKIRINRQFEDTVFARLDAIVSSKSQNFDSEAVSAINNIASINLNEFKSAVNNIILNHCMRKNDTGIDLQSIQGIDLSQLNVDGLSYNLDLNTIGHEYDQHITLGVKVVGTVAAVAAVVATAGAAAPAAAAAGTTEAGAAVATGAAEAGAAAMSAGEMALGAASAIDTVTDIGSMVSNARTVSRVQQAVQLAGEAGAQYSNINQINQAVGQQTGQSKGFIEGMVGFVTDKAWGKPQRRRAIHNYLDETLMPQFKLSMDSNCLQVVNKIRELLLNAAQVTIAEKKLALEELVKQHESQKEAFAQRLNILRDYKNELLTQ